MGEPRTRDTLPPVRPTHHQLKVLGAIVRQGSLKAAAAELEMTAKAVKQVTLMVHERLGVHTTLQAVWACRRLLEPLVVS